MATTTQNAATTGTAEWVPNRTFPKAPAGLTRTMAMDAYLGFGMDCRKTVHFYGDHGIGKTSKVKEFFTKRDIEIVYINLANTTPDDKIMSAPVTGPDGEMALRQLIMEDMTPGKPFVVVLDDGRQAAKQVQNQYMQLMNNWRLGQHALDGLVAVVALDNEGAAEGIRTSEDLAVADRKVTVRLNANDTGWRYALAAKYKTTDLNGVFAVWDSLPSDLRKLLSPRSLDHIIYCTQNGFPPICGLPILGGSRVRLTVATEAGAQDRTVEILKRIASELNVAYVEDVPDLARKVIRAALRDRLAVSIEGAPGIGKTAVTQELIAEAGMDQVYYSMPFTDVESLVAPIPTRDGKLRSLISEELRSQKPFAIVWDEYNRPSSVAAFAKAMEVTQEWSVAGLALDNCRAQIALMNPPEYLGRRMQVMKGNIAQADRFTISVQIGEDDIPATAWLLTQWPDTVSNGDPARRERARSIMETTIEWYKNDIGAEHRQWITKRTLERLALLHMNSLPLDVGKIYLGEGEYAPVPLIDLENRLRDRPMARLGEIAADVEHWEQLLRDAQETSEVGTNDVDQVHQALALAELSQLEAHRDVVARLARLLPPKYKITFYTGATTEAQRFWTAIYAQVRAAITAEQSAAA